MADKRFNFTKKELLNLPTPPKGKRAYHYDTHTRGLTLCVTSSGTKTFYLYRKIHGRAERIRIAAFPDMSIERARGAASKLNADIADGKNPQDEKRAISAEITLGELFDEYLERHAKVHKIKWREDAAQFRRYLAHWKSRKLSQINRKQIHTLHAELGKERGHYAANRLLALLHTVFNKAMEWGWSGPNPAHRVKKFREQSRERFLQPDELPRFFEAVAEEPNEAARDYVLLSLLTGARQSNVLAMRWEQVNIERATWTIPKTKNGDPHTVPLVSQAVSILRDRTEASTSPWVLPSKSQSGHLMDPKRPWERILERAGIQDLRLHDLRRSLGSWQASTGANLSIIGKTLAHKNVSTTAIYARLSLDPVRDAMNKATDAMLQAGGVLKGGDVVKIRKIG